MPVHPHVRGADAAASASARATSGSPPRMWGRPLGSEVEIVVTRFTPTYVGQTTSGRRHSARNAVHPHVRGADDIAARKQRLDLRFTPTYVGQTVEER